MNDEVRIFISYARLDAGEVIQLYHRLKAAGFHPWIDREDLLPGVKWRVAIEKAIREADFFLLCLSPRSSNRRGFLQREINAALDLWEERMTDDIYFIPLRLEECEIPERVDEFQCVDWFEDGGWERLMKALRVQVERLGKKMPEPGVVAQPSFPPPAPSAPAVVPGRGAPGQQVFDFTTVTLDARGQIVERKPGQARCSVEDLGGGVKLEMVEIAGGEFWMGSTDADAQAAFNDAKRYWKDAEQQWYTRETPRHRVAVSSFFMGKHPVTQAQWMEVMGNLPEISDDLRGDDRPVVMVSWEEAVEFCRELSRRTKRQYRLPTEAEWEYACRAGTNTPFAFGQNINPEVVNYAGSQPYGSASQGTYRQKTVPVGSLGVANVFGLYDMHGNVWEWCSDWYSSSYYEECRKQGMVTDPQGPATGSDRVYRGGGWYFHAVLCRSAYRINDAPGFRDDGVGFRLVRVGR
ncbi:MAG: SUMF1/EgtB/PvdO family nonheme iron enzyme [Blastocatellia bacterium]